MKFLYFGDRHYSFKNPENRLDDFQLTGLMKDKEIINIGKTNKVTAFLHPGDFFNEVDIHGENEYIDSVMNRWGLIKTNDIISSVKNNEINCELLNKINEYIPLVGIVGNHDLIGNSLDTLPKTTIGHLSSIGQMNLVTKDNPMYFFTEDGLKVAITGTHYHLNTDEPEYIDDYIIKEKLGDIHIHIVHGMLSNKDMGSLIKHTKIDDIKQTKADITLCGHNHIGFGIIKTEDKYFVNIGSVTRISNDIKEVSRMPEVALIDISKKGIKIEEIPLISAKSGLEILDRTKTEKDSKKQKSINEFKKEIKNLKDSKKTVNIKDFIITVAKSKGISDDIKTDILNRLIEKETLMTKTKNEKNDAYVSKVILENFQSHEYSEFELENGFNVFVGESRQGKSAVQRALYWVYENKPSGKNNIKRGKSYAKVTIYLSNGAMVSRYVESSKNGKNTYEIIYPDGRIESGNTKLLEQVQRVLGFNYFKIDSKLSLPINFYKQGESWYLIGDKLSATDKARVIGALNGTNLSDYIIRDLDSENSKILTLNKISEKKCEDLNKELEELKKFDELKNNIEKNETLLKKYIELKNKKENIEKNLFNYNESILNLEKIKTVINKLKDIDILNLKLNKMKEIQFNLSNILKEYNRYSEFNESLYYTQIILNKLKISTDLNLKIKKLSDLYSDFNNINSYFSKFNEFNKKIDKVNRILDKTKDISLLKDKISLFNELNNKYANLNMENLKNKEIKDKIIEIKTKLEKLNKIYGINNLFSNYNDLDNIQTQLIEKYTDYKKVKSILNKETMNKVKLNHQFNKSKKEYSQVLKDTNSCPICKRMLDEHTINNIIEENN